MTLPGVRAALASPRRPSPGSPFGLTPARSGGKASAQLVRAPRSTAREVVNACKAAAGVRSAHKDAGSVRLQVDPTEIG